MVPRRVALTFVAALLATGLAACAAAPAPTGSPTPTATPTEFASQDEAFAAAEATYRAYNEASNAYNAGDTSVDPLDFLMGDVKKADAEIRRQSQDAGLRFTGATRITSVDHRRVTTVGGLTDVELAVCLDDTEVHLINVEGEDVTLPDVPKVYLLGVTLTGRGEDSMKISKSELESENC